MTIKCYRFVTNLSFYSYFFRHIIERKSIKARALMKT